jgi:hypothetical protein
MSMWAQVPTWLQAVVWASLTGTLLAAAVMGVEWLVRGRVPARWRLGLWLLVLVRLAAVPLPESSWSVFNYLPGGMRGEVAAKGRGNDEIRMINDEANLKSEIQNMQSDGSRQGLVSTSADWPAPLKTAGLEGGEVKS